MSKVNIAVLGGCHVVGYPLERTKAFPVVLSELLEAEVVKQVANLQFVHLPKQLDELEAVQSTHVVLQLGNYEFSASLRLLLHQFKRAFGISLLASPAAASSSAHASVALAASDYGVPRTSKPAYYLRVAGLGLLTTILWVFSARHRQSFRALNAYVRRQPDTLFIFLSPFPCLEPAANTMRRFGGRLMRRWLIDAPNFYWFDSHRLLRADRRLFVDQLHLNEEAHRVVAHGLAAIAVRQATCLV